MRRVGTLIAVALLAAVSLGVVTLLRSPDALAAALAAAALACLAPSRRSATALLSVAGLCAAAAHGAAARDRALHPSLLTWFDEQAGDADRLPSLVEIDGILAADATLVDGGAQLVVDVRLLRLSGPLAGPGAPAAALTAAAETASPRSIELHLAGRVQIHVGGEQAGGRVRDWTGGRRVRAPVMLRRPPILLNFGGSSPFWQRLRRSFALAGSVKSAALVDVERGAPWDEIAAGARWRARDAAARFIAPGDPQAAAIVTAILIGDRAGLDDDVVRRLQVAGTYHVIAISGGNVALLTGLCFGVLRLLFRSPRVVSMLTLVATLAYGGVVGGDPSVARAVTAAAIYLGISLAGLMPSPMGTLRTTALVLAVVDPLVVCDVGAWLSFGATFGILLLAGRLTRSIPWPALPPWLSRIARPIAVLIAATMAAEVMLLPISAAVFGRVTVAGILLNLVAIPAMAFAEIAGLLTVMVGPALPAIGSAFGRVASFAAQVLVSSSGLVDWWPWLWWRVPGVSREAAAFFYAVVIALVCVPSRGRGRRVILVSAALGVAVAAAATVLERWTAPPRPLRVSVLDVGQGDAILIQFPHGQALLVDAGGSPGAFDVGTRVVTPSAWALGVRALTWLAVTHGDRDHAGGAYGVAEELSPREIWEAIPVPANREVGRVHQLAWSRGMAWRTVRAGAHLEVGGVRIDTVHPIEPDWERQKVRNDDSMVLRIRYGRVEVLLTGDAGAEFESRLPADLAEAPIRILKAGHHGSRTSTSMRLIDAMHPQVALVSVGRGNAFGHPSPDVIDRLRGAGAEIFRTDRDGAISVEIDGATARVVTALGRSWTIAVRGPS